MHANEARIFGELRAKAREIRQLQTEKRDIALGPGDEDEERAAGVALAATGPGGREVVRGGLLRRSKEVPGGPRRSKDPPGTMTVHRSELLQLPENRLLLERLAAPATYRPVKRSSSKGSRCPPRGRGEGSRGGPWLSPTGAGSSGADMIPLSELFLKLNAPPQTTTAGGGPDGRRTFNRLLADNHILSVPPVVSELRFAAGGASLGGAGAAGGSFSTASTSSATWRAGSSSAAAAGALAGWGPELVPVGDLYRGTGDLGYRSFTYGELVTKNTNERSDFRSPRPVPREGGSFLGSSASARRSPEARQFRDLRFARSPEARQFRDLLRSPEARPGSERRGTSSASAGAAGADRGRADYCDSW